MELFLKRIEKLLEKHKYEYIDEKAFISLSYGLLTDLYDLNFSKDEVYQSLLERYIYYMYSDEIKSDLIADLMDFVVGFCSPCNIIWDNDRKP